MGGVQGKAEQGASLKECTAWTNEIRELWRKVSEASGERAVDRRGGTLWSKKGFEFVVGEIEQHSDPGLTSRWPVH